MLYLIHLTWVGFKLTTLVVIGTDCIGSHKSNYHMITIMTAPGVQGVDRQIQRLPTIDWFTLFNKHQRKLPNESTFLHPYCYPKTKYGRIYNCKSLYGCQRQRCNIYEWNNQWKLNGMMNWHNFQVKNYERKQVESKFACFQVNSMTWLRINLKT